MTSLRPIGKSKENDRIQELFVKSVTSINEKITFSLTQFDDANVEGFLKNNKINCKYKNFEKSKLPIGKKYSNKIMLENCINQFLENNYDYFVYSTADILVPNNLFSLIKEKIDVNIYPEFCSLIYPNILSKNGKIKSVTTPHYGIDIFVFKISKISAEKLKSAIMYWQQYDWGINDNFFVSVCELLKIPIFNLYKDLPMIKYENDFETVNENRDWQINSWKENQTYFKKYLAKNKLTSLYAIGSYHFLLYKIFRFKDMNYKLLLVYLKFYLFTPVLIFKKILNLFNFK